MGAQRFRLILVNLKLLAIIQLVQSQRSVCFLTLGVLGFGCLFLAICDLLDFEFSKIRAMESV